MQILWLFRIPMAISMTLTRCAISIFFIRTLYTKIYPRLRHTGIYESGTFPSRKTIALIDTLCSALLHHHSNHLGSRFYHSNGASLPADTIQLYDTP
jgi:hypothetical protein